MKTFKDNTGREWSVPVTVGTVKLVRDKLQLDILDIENGTVFKKLVSDPILLCDVIFVLCGEQAKERGVSDEEFGRAMAGDAIEQATDAFLEALADFFPNPKRQALKKANARLRGLETKAVKLAMERLDSPELDRLMEQALGEWSTTVPGSSAFIPTPSPSAS